MSSSSKGTKGNIETTKGSKEKNQANEGKTVNGCSKGQDKQISQQNNQNKTQNVEWTKVLAKGNKGIK